MKKIMALAVLVSISSPTYAMQGDPEDPTNAMDEEADVFDLQELDAALPPATQPRRQSLFSLVQQRQYGLLPPHVFERRVLSIVSQDRIAVAKLAADFLRDIKIFYRLASDAPVTSVYTNFSQCLTNAYLTGDLNLGNAQFAGGNVEQPNEISFENGPCFKFFSEVFLPNYGHRITSINLSDCGLDAPPAWLERCPCLVELDLCGNPLDATSKNFSLLHNVSRLTISQCNLLTVPEDLQNMPMLCWLDLCDNLKIQIPNWVGSLRLTTLKLAACKLRTIPACIRNITTLQYLNVSLNPNLADLPEWILTEPPHLTKINLWNSAVPAAAKELLLQKRGARFTIKR